MRVGSPSGWSQPSILSLSADFLSPSDGTGSTPLVTTPDPYSSPVPTFRRNTPRRARPSAGFGYMEFLCLLSDSTNRGRLPPHTVSPDTSAALGIMRHSDDYADSWVGQSLEPQGGNGLFFRVRGRMHAGFLIAVY